MDMMTGEYRLKGKVEAPKMHLGMDICIWKLICEGGNQDSGATDEGRWCSMHYYQNLVGVMRWMVEIGR
eukprot:1800199-Ditylum_brightwellii.AAC.1